MDCPICQMPASEHFAACYVTAAKCAVCGHIFALDPAPGQGIQTHPDPDDEYRRFDERNRRLIGYWRRRGFLRDSAAILDIGAGSGHVLRTLRRVMPTVSITAMEGDEASASFLRGEGFRLIDDLNDADPTGYDAILLLEVIEHIVDPVRFLRICGSLLREGGAIFLTTPCGETRRGSRATNAYDTAEHVQFFTERSLARCCRSAGLELNLRTINAMHPPHGRLRTIAAGAARVARDRILGRVHLTGFASL